ncbi:MAG: CYTH domain-containing protein [Bacteroidetes bacterium]|nr:CYTH domain-containing protein [Bacteroidota bacterium]
MALEIERKFLVDHNKWAELPKPSGTLYRQGYLNDEPGKTIRVRAAGDKGFLTIKGPPLKTVRQEFEFEIPLSDTYEILELFSLRKVEKVRYRILFNQKIWEVDVFDGENEGLILAEIELRQADESFTTPSWIGREVTDDPRYYNSYLASNPYKKWDQK